MSGGGTSQCTPLPEKSGSLRDWDGEKGRLSVQVPLSKSEFYRKPAESPEQSGCLSGSSPAVLSIVCAGSWWGQGDLMMTPLQQLQESWTGSRNAAPRKDPTFKFKLSRFDGRLNRVRERGGNQSCLQDCGRATRRRALLAEGDLCRRQAKVRGLSYTQPM